MVIISFYGMLNQCPGAPDSRTQMLNIYEMILILNFCCIYVFSSISGHLFNMIIALDFLFSPFFFTRNSLTHLRQNFHMINCMKFYYLYEKIIFICENSQY